MRQHLSAVALLSIVALGVGCAAPTSPEPETESSSDGLTSNGVNIGEHWHSAVRCDGAHIDVFDGGYWYYKQVVIDDPGAAAYLRGKLDNAISSDPFSRSVSKNGVIRGSRPNELVMYFVDSSDTTRDLLFSSAVTGGNEIRVDVRKQTSETNQGSGLYRKDTSMTVRFVRNGWREYHCDPGLSGDPPSCGSNGDGWNEWEIVNWTFRGCHNI
jgi:hypothetical protein